MRTRFVEATQDEQHGFNHGKFLVGLFDADEWDRPPQLPRGSGPPSHAEMDSLPGSPPSLLRRCGWNSAYDSLHVFVMDLQTGEGAMFQPGGLPSADLDKHRVWVCPMFEPFLAWLYGHVREANYVEGDGSPLWFNELPALVELPGVPGALAGYRREGPVEGRPTREQTERWKRDPQIVPLSATRPGDDEPEGSGG